MYKLWENPMIPIYLSASYGWDSHVFIRITIKKPKLLDTLKWIRVAFIQIQEVYRMSKEIWHLVIACMYRAFTFAYQNTF